ncbi:MAG: hypothetical protein Q9195_000644 [Heterodermia aff. obscurata]
MARKMPQSRISVTSQYEILQIFQSGNMTLKKSKTVELRDGDFLKIDTLLQAETTEVFLQGRRFRRTTKLEDLKSARPNEVCWFEEAYLDESYVEEMIPLDHVVRIRKLKMTNILFKSFNISHTMQWPPTTRLYRDEGILFCRTKAEFTYESHAQKAKANSFSFVSRCFRSLYPAEVDDDFGQDPAALRAAWQGLPTTMDRFRRSTSTVTLVGDEERLSPGATSPRRRYTFGDCFCGGGGMSCGAKLAGLDVKWGLDFNREAMRTYQLNFDGASCENAGIEQFLNADIFSPADYRVDVLHLSPPCQSFSPAQVVKPEDFEDKQAVILAVNDLVKMVRPRIVTMEETFGLLHRANREFFIYVVSSLVDQDYSVRWKVMNFGEYGVPQDRRRVVLIASGPGEVLPDFPQPTHTSNRTTIASSISNIPASTPNHHPKEFLYPRRPYEADGPLQNLIATGGGLDNYHPDGKRPFTEREFACLQTFPLDYKFVGKRTDIMKQIGNAVPPLPAKTLCEEILRTLRKTDGEI